MTAIVTAYCACAICCGPRAAGMTASGVRPQQGVTVAASRSVPFGVRLRVAGLSNTFIVQDRLSKRLDSRVDIYFASHQDAKKFGITRRQITLSWPPPP